MDSQKITPPKTQNTQDAQLAAIAAAGVLDIQNESEQQQRKEEEKRKKLVGAGALGFLAQNFDKLGGRSLPGKSLVASDEALQQKKPAYNPANPQQNPMMKKVILEKLREPAVRSRKIEVRQEESGQQDGDESRVPSEQDGQQETLEDQQNQMQQPQRNQRTENVTAPQRRTSGSSTRKIAIVAAASIGVPLAAASGAGMFQILFGK